MSGKEKILEAAKNVIMQKGIDGATVRNIAKEAGLTTGALYHHYRNKEEILYEVLDSEFSITNHITRLLDEGKLTSETLLKAIQAQIDKRLGSMLEHKLRFYLSHEAALGNPVVKSKLAEAYEHWTQNTARLFAPAFGIPESPKAQGAAIIMIAALDGIANLQIMDALPFDTEEISEIYKDFFTYAIPKYLVEKE